MSKGLLDPEQRKELKAIFDAVARNGKLSTPDLAFLIRSFEPHQSDWEVQDLISEIDVGGHSSGDGRVDFEVLRL